MGAERDALLWCNVSHSASVSFPPGLYETLEAIAREKKAAATWGVREVAERYLTERWPLPAMEAGRLYECHG